MDSEIKQTFIGLLQQLDAAQTSLHEKIIASFSGKTIAEIRAELQDDTASVLEFIVEISSETEHYEICAAAQQLLNEKR